MPHFLSYISLGLVSTAVSASILPPHHFKLSKSLIQKGLSREQYNRVIDKVEWSYRSHIEKMGFKLSINREWDDDTVNAGTLKNGKEWIINLYGGYARHPLITEDAFTLVVCHELGHHLGGYPRKTDDGVMFWAATEGQADYFATLKCLRKVLALEDHSEVLRNLNPSIEVSRECKKYFRKTSDQSVCIRSSEAGMAVARIAASVIEAPLPKFDTPDEFVTDSIIESHPSPQCRLDTYFQGSLCTISPFIPLSQNNEVTGACHERSGFLSGARPLCWFRSSQ